MEQHKNLRHNKEFKKEINIYMSQILNCEAVI